MEKGQSFPSREMVIVWGNKTMVCQIPNSYRTNVWLSGNPLNSPTSLFLLQLTLISFASHFIEYFLKPLSQSSIVSQILGGVVFGPSALGHEKLLSRRLFPLRSTVLLETIATFGLMFFFFVVGTKTDAATVFRLERKPIIIGLSVFVFTLGLPIALSMTMKTYLSLDTPLSKALPFIAASQCVTAFPVIGCLLEELKILNTNVGRLAMSSALVIDIVGIALTAFVFSLMQNRSGSVVATLFSVATTIGLLLVIVYAVRPRVLWMLKRCKKRRLVAPSYIFTISVFVLVSGLLSEIIGQHFVFGPLVLGLVVPDGPPLGAALVYKLDTIVSWFFYPTYLAVSGLKTDVYKIDLQSLVVVGSVVLFACVVRIVAVMVPARYATDIPVRESLVLGLVLSAKGIVELVVYNLWKGTKILADQEFALMVLSVILVTAIIAPLIKILYDPSKEYKSMKRSTIQHSKRDGELRIMICIHNKDNISTIIDLLEVSRGSQDSTIVVTALMLEELVGRTRPILVAHQNHPVLETEECTNIPVLNALNHYELCNEGSASIESFTSTSHYSAMHEDVLRIAFDSKVVMIIVPFYKQWTIDGSVESTNRGIEALCLNVLENAPCSVGILIDRGILRGSTSLFTTNLEYNVAVIFIGGADDAEALAYGARMAKHDSVDLTVIRFLAFGSENSKDRRRDTALIDEYRRANIGNDHFVIVEEVIKDGIGLASCVKGMTDGIDLLLVGREHLDSPLLMGHDQWSECPELGVVGDMLASPDFGINSSVLVVQQQRIGRTLVINHNHAIPVPTNDRDQVVSNNIRHEEPPRWSWAISVERQEDSKVILYE